MVKYFFIRIDKNRIINRQHREIKIIFQQDYIDSILIFIICTDKNKHRRRKIKISKRFKEIYRSDFERLNTRIALLEAMTSGEEREKKKRNVHPYISFHPLIYTINSWSGIPRILLHTHTHTYIFIHCIRNSRKRKETHLQD